MQFIFSSLPASTLFCFFQCYFLSFSYSFKEHFFFLHIKSKVKFIAWMFPLAERWNLTGQMKYAGFISLIHLGKSAQKRIWSGEAIKKQNITKGKKNNHRKWFSEPSVCHFQKGLVVLFERVINSVRHPICAEGQHLTRVTVPGELQCVLWFLTEPLPKPVEIKAPASFPPGTSLRCCCLFSFNVKIPSSSDKKCCRRSIHANLFSTSQYSQLPVTSSSLPLLPLKKLATAASCPCQKNAYWLLGTRPVEKLFRFSRRMSEISDLQSQRSRFISRWWTLEFTSFFIRNKCTMGCLWFSYTVEIQCWIQLINIRGEIPVK